MIHIIRVDNNTDRVAPNYISDLIKLAISVRGLRSTDQGVLQHSNHVTSSKLSHTLIYHITMHLDFINKRQNLWRQNIAVHSTHFWNGQPRDTLREESSQTNVILQYR